MDAVFNNYNVCEDVADAIAMEVHSSGIEEVNDSIHHVGWKQRMKDVHTDMCVGEGGRTGQYNYDISANGHWFNWWWRSRWYGQPGYGAWVAIVGGRFKE